MSKIFILLSIFSLVACESFITKEAKKNAKANAASSRINASQSNNSDLLRELDN